MRRPSENAPGERDGLPGYVFGWCCKAEAKTMQRGYRDVGYLLIQRSRNFRPSNMPKSVWQERLRTLVASCRGNDAKHVWAWCMNHYPTLACRIPKEQRNDFVAGMVERVWMD